MKTSTPTDSRDPDAAFTHIDGINMEVAVELLGQQIAKRAEAIEDEEKGSADPVLIQKLRGEMSALRQRQEGLRSENTAEVQAVFDEYGRVRSPNES